MILPDINVLIYAFRTDSKHHEKYNAWLQRTLESTEELALHEVVLAGVIRLVTNSRAFSNPAPMSDILIFINQLIAAPRTRWLSSSVLVWQRFENLSNDDQAIKGDLVPDAYLAALAITHNARLATADRGFARYPGLKWFDPGSAGN